MVGTGGLVFLGCTTFRCRGTESIARPSERTPLLAPEDRRVVLDELGEASWRSTQELLEGPRDLGRGATRSLICGQGERALDHPGRGPRANEPLPSFLGRLRNVFQGVANCLPDGPGDVPVAQRLGTREYVFLPFMAWRSESDRRDRGDVPRIDEWNLCVAGGGPDPSLTG